MKNVNLTSLGCISNNIGIKIQEDFKFNLLLKRKVTYVFLTT